MKSAFLIMILGLFIYSATAQDDCRYQINKVDDFTGKKIVQTRAERLALDLKSEVYFKAAFDNEKYFFLVEIVWNRPYNIEEGDEIIFLFTDGSMAKIIAEDDEGVGQPDGRTTKYKLELKYLVEEEVWQELKTKDIQKLRITLDDKNLDLEVRVNKANLLAEMISCTESA